MAVTTFAPAKLNLFLHILDKREDGYHNLQTLFQLLAWGDLVSLSLTKDASQIKMHGNYAAMVSQDSGQESEQGNIQEQKSNLAYRALELMQKECRPPKDIQNAKINIQKNIPVGAGLGGGSSDAAAVLRILRLLWKPQMPLDELAQLGASLGADVPLFVHGFSAFAEGIGAKLTRFNIPSRHYLIICPEVHSSTAELFSALNKQKDRGRSKDGRRQQTRKNAHEITNCLIRKFASAPQEAQGRPQNNIGPDDGFWRSFLSLYAKASANDFMPPLMDKFPQLEALYKLIDGLTPDKTGKQVFLSGSGSAMFVVYENQDAALKMQKLLQKEIGPSFVSAKPETSEHHSSPGSIPFCEVYICRGVYCATNII